MKQTLGGRQVPGTWSEALEILQNNYANSLVIQALADALHYKLVIITVHGVNYLILLLYLKQYKSYGAELSTCKPATLEIRKSARI